MKTNIGFLLCLFVVVITFVMPVTAAERLIISSEASLAGDYNKDEYTIDGGLEITYKKTIIKAGGMIYWQREKKAKLAGPLNLSHEDVLISAGGLDFLFEDEKGIFSDSIAIQKKEDQPSGGKKRTDPFILYCNRLEFDTKAKNFTAQNGARLLHKDFTGYAQQILYNDGLQELTLLGKAQMTRPEGDNVKGGKIVINLNSKSFEVFEEVNLEFIVE